MTPGPGGQRGPRLLWRGLAAFLACPGLVAYLLPGILVWRAGKPPRLPAPGAVLLALGSGLLLWCVRDFHIAGRGTLAPWAPPEKLVVVGLYRCTRNPMYVAVGIILLGWWWGFGGGVLAVYGLAVMLAFQLRIVLGEEPWLAARHGRRWTHYRARVPRWLF